MLFIHLCVCINLHSHAGIHCTAPSQHHNTACACATFLIYIWIIYQHKIKALFTLLCCTYFCLARSTASLIFISFVFCFFFLLFYPYLFPLTRAHHASTLLRSSLKPGPSSVTSATTSAWLWRNLFKSTGLCTEWFLLIYILPDTVTDRANQPITALETDRHSFTGEMGWDEFDWLADCHRAAGALQNHLCTAGRQYYVGARVCVSVCASTLFFAGVCTYGCACECGWSSLTQITHCTLSAVTGKESGCQVGPAHIFKGWQN